MWVGFAPWPSRYCTVVMWPPEQARDRTVWSLVVVCLLTSAPVCVCECVMGGEKRWGVLIKHIFCNCESKMQQRRLQNSILQTRWTLLCKETVYFFYQLTKLFVKLFVSCDGIYIANLCWQGTAQPGGDQLWQPSSAEFSLLHTHVPEKRDSKTRQEIPMTISASPYMVLTNCTKFLYVLFPCFGTDVPEYGTGSGANFRLMQFVKLAPCSERIWHVRIYACVDMCGHVRVSFLLPQKCMGLKLININEVF